MALDFKGVAAAALAVAHQLVPAWLDGKPEGHEWIAVNPNRPGSNGSGAFRVNLHTGAWADFAGEAKGGDLISLYAYVKGVGNGAACREVAAELRISAEDGSGPAAGTARQWVGPKSAPTAPAAPRSVTARDVDGELVLPVPADAPSFNDSGALDMRRLGPAQAWWPYHNAAGELLLYVVRYPDPSKGADAKQFYPWTVWRRPDGRMKWCSKAIPAPRPLYRLHEITRRDLADIVVCEGEKAADAAQLLLPECVASTTLNGAKSPDKSDWSPVEGRRVLVWPDHDAAGIGYANKVVMLARDAGATSVRVLSFSWISAVLAACQPKGAA